MASVCDAQLAEESFRQNLSLDKLVTRALLCRTELAFLQYSMRRLSSSSSWTPELQEHLEVLEELLRRESASAYFEMANLPAVSLVHLRAKADALRQLCGLDDTDLRGMLTARCATTCWRWQTAASSLLFASRLRLFLSVACRVYADQ